MKVMHAHHRTIRNLVAALRQARAEAEFWADRAHQADERALRARRAMKEAEAEAEAEARRLRNEEYFRQEERDRALRDLERAYGDDYEFRRALERLKRY